MQRIDELVASFLRQTRVVPEPLPDAVLETAREIWPGLPENGVQIGSFRRGVLLLGLDNHARVAEARGFHSEHFRHRLNERLAGKSAPLGRGMEREALYVTRLVFRAIGAFS